MYTVANFCKQPKQPDFHFKVSGYLAAIKLTDKSGYPDNGYPDMQTLPTATQNFTTQLQPFQRYLRGCETVNSYNWSRDLTTPFSGTICHRQILWSSSSAWSRWLSMIPHLDVITSRENEHITWKIHNSRTASGKISWYCAFLHQLVCECCPYSLTSWIQVLEDGQHVAQSCDILICSEKEANNLIHSVGSNS